jgi:DNA repair protein NreA
MKPKIDSKLKELRDSSKAYSLIKRNSFNKKAKKDYFGASPNVFIGRFGYPNINVGFLSNEVLSKDVDSPKTWSKNNYSIQNVIDLRSELINSRFKTNIKTFDQKLLEITREVSQAEEAVDVEVNLNKKPNFSLNFDNEVTPYGPSVELKKAKITENTKIKKSVDKVVTDTDLRATEGLSYLYKKGYDEKFLTKLLSVGNLGVNKDRKLVPTRWSITATDDTLGKNLITEIKKYNEYDYKAFFGGYQGNYYLILFFPELWSYELFETYVGDMTNHNNLNPEFGTDYESYNGRKYYANNTAGGYYAARLPILEYLKKVKRQSSVIALRFVTSDYYVGLGVWVVRQATRHALLNNPITFSSKELMLTYAKKLVKKKFGKNLDYFLNQSQLLKLGHQKPLSKFF